MDFWVWTALLLAVALAYETFKARRASRRKREGSTDGHLDSNPNLIFGVAAIAGSEIGAIIDRGAAMAALVILGDVVIRHASAAVIFGYWRRWLKLSKRQVAVTTLTMFWGGYKYALQVLGSLAVYEAVTHRFHLLGG
jgi:hypothetical protein